MGFWVIVGGTAVVIIGTWMMHRETTTSFAVAAKDRQEIRTEMRQGFDGVQAEVRQGFSDVNAALRNLSDRDQPERSAPTGEGAEPAPEQGQQGGVPPVVTPTGNRPPDDPPAIHGQVLAGTEVGYVRPGDRPREEDPPGSDR